MARNRFAKQTKSVSLFANQVGGEDGGWFAEATGAMLTPLGLGQVMAARRGEKAEPVSKRAIAAGLKVQMREDRVLAPQRPMVAHAVYENFLRMGRSRLAGTEAGT